MKSWYMWSGIGAIGDFEDFFPECHTDEQALDWFIKRAPNFERDYTLWTRAGDNVRLLAIKRVGQNVQSFVPDRAMLRCLDCSRNFQDVQGAHVHEDETNHHIAITWHAKRHGLLAPDAPDDKSPDEPDHPF